MTSVLAGSDAGMALDGCRVCELRRLELNCPTPVGNVIGVYSDRDVVVFMQPGADGVYVAPTSHVGDISGFDSTTLGGFLGSLRRVSVLVRTVYGGSGPIISPEPSAIACADGHACFLVAPTGRKRAGKRTVSTDPMIDAERLASGLQ